MRYLKILIVITLNLTTLIGFGQIDIENEIISALIKSEIKSLPNDTVFTRKGKIKEIRTCKVPDIILINETETYLFDPKVDSFSRFKNETNGLPSLDNDSYQDFIVKNKSRLQIDSIRDFPGEVKYVSAKEIEIIFKQGGWENYHKIFGAKPLIKISRPGLNSDKTKGFVYYSSSIGGLSGAGFYLILEKVDGKWIVKETMFAWIS
ncbi:MAG: hypothetical protein IPH20_17500 [Bacteroidales bacterium]|nr:hypothetical protein [Bacteroidales bacterium]